MTAAHICICCAHCKTSIVKPRGSEPKEIIFECQQGHAPIWLFSGELCPDYKSKQSELQEQKCTKK